jgi:hypothetical protein
LYFVLFSILTLIWQLFVLFACCFGVGLSLRFLLPKGFSLLNQVLFSLMGGLFLVVLIAQNLVYVGVPVRISAWLILAVALVQVCWCRHQLPARMQSWYSDVDLRTLAAVIILIITFHGIVPIRQGLEWYYGKGYDDQLNYVLLAEFLKEEPYRTSTQDVPLRPWLVRAAGYLDTPEQVGMNPGKEAELIGIKEQRIGQSIITAEISVWSGTDGKAGYAATVIFSITLLAICLYVMLRETGTNCFLAGSGALLAAFLPAVTRLSLDGFLSQTSILFAFPFFVSLLRRRELSARSFTLFSSLTLAYVVAAYSEVAPFGICTFVLGVMFVRGDKMRSKRLMLMSAIILVALMNPFYLRNLIGFLGRQYYMAGNAPFLAHMAPNIVTLRGWSELIFGAVPSAPFALFFDYCALLLCLLFFAAAILLTRRDKLIFGAVLLPVILVIYSFASRIPPSYFPIAKIVLTVLPFSIGLVFVPLSKVAANRQDRSIEVLKKLVGAVIVAAAAAGSAQYYSEVLNNGGLLRYVREPGFQNVCRELEKIKNKRVLVFETLPLLTPWLCYHARHNDVYFDARLISESSFPDLDPFAKIPDLVNVDFVVTRDQIVDLRAPSVSCLTLVDDPQGEDKRDGHVFYGIGPPADLRFLALRPISANLKMRLGPGPEATTFPIDFFLADDQGHVSRGEIRAKSIDVRRMNLPKGLSTLQLSVRAKDDDPNTVPSFPIVAELDDLELSEIAFDPGR